MGKLIIEKDGVRGDVADIAQLFKETGVNLDQFLTIDQNPNKHIAPPRSAEQLAIHHLQCSAVP